MDYKAVVTKEAEEDLERFIQYFIIEKKSMQAAENLRNDYDVCDVEIPEYEYTEEDTVVDGDLKSNESYEEVENDG